MVVAHLFTSQKLWVSKYRILIYPNKFVLFQSRISEYDQISEAQLFVGQQTTIRHAVTSTVQIIEGLDN